MKNDRKASDVLTRRRLLARVGLAAGAAYVAPVMMGLNAAHASGASGGNSGGNSGASRGGNSAPSRSRASAPSRGTSAPSRGRASGPSRARGRAGSDVPAWLRRMMQGA